MLEADRELRLALLALRRNRLNRDELLSLLESWSAQPSRSIVEMLVARGWLDGTEIAEFDAELDQPEDSRDSPTRTQSLLPADDPTATRTWFEVDRTGPTQVLSTTPDGNRHAERTLPMTTATASRAGSQPVTSGTRYHLVRQLAQGGLGVVYVARDAELNREVALKEIRPHLDASESSRARFLVEAEITGNLEHPGIVPIYSLSAHPDGRPYYAMRLIRGESLMDAIVRFHESRASLARPPADRAAEFRNLIGRLIAACHALAYAHSRGVIHRDVKPSNIMLGPFHETLVVDWGLAKASGRPEPGADEPAFVPGLSGDSNQTRPGSAIGTPQYMSPEQARGELEHVGPRSDVYSLGATLYVLLTGRVPFDAPEPLIVMGQVQRGDFPRPRSILASVPRALEAICLKAMALRPEDRYESPIALADDLERWLSDEPVTAHRETIADRLMRWSRRHRAWSLAGAIALLAIAMAATVATVLVDRARGRERLEREHTERLRADLLLDQSDLLLSQGYVAPGLLRLAEGLTQLEVRADLDRYRRAFEANINAWSEPLAPLRAILPHPTVLTGAIFDGTGRVAITAANTLTDGQTAGELRFWDARTGQPLGKSVRAPRPIRALALVGQNGTAIATADAEGTVQFWSIGERRSIGGELTMPGGIAALAVSDDRSGLAVSGPSGSLVLWDVADPARPVERLRSHLDDSSESGKAPETAAIQALAWHGTRLAIGRLDGTVELRDARTLERVGTSSEQARVRGGVTALAFAPDGQRLAVSDSLGNVRLFDPDANTDALDPIQSLSAVYSLAFSPDGDRFVTGGEDNLARVYWSEDGTPDGLALVHLGSVVSAGFSADGRTLLTGSLDGHARLWTLPDYVETWISDGSPSPVVCVGSGSADRGVWIVHDGGQVRGFDHEGRAVASWDIGRPVLRAALGANGSRLVTAHPEGAIRCWSLPDGKLLGDLSTLRGAATAIAADSDGSRVLIGREDGTAQVYNARLDRAIGASIEHGWAVEVVAFSGDGRRMLTAGGGLARVWDVADGTPVGPPILADGPIHSATFLDREGESLATGGESNTLRLWSVRDGRPIGVPMMHEGSIRSIAASRDGRRLLSGSGDGRARLWSMETWTALGPPLILDGPVTAVGFTWGDREALGGDRQGYVRRVPIPQAAAIDASRLKDRIEARTGLAFEFSGDPSGILRVLSPEEIAEREPPRDGP